MWTLCNVAPYNAEECLVQYSLGLGCNTMEGREQKHQRIAKYAENTTFQNRWPLIFTHEFIQLIYLRENGYDKKQYLKKNTNYVPTHENGSCKKCIMKLVNNKCKMCNSNFMVQVENTILKG